MPKMTINGVEEIGYLIDKLDANTKTILKKGLYDANKIIYKEVESRISALPTGDRSVSEKQKEGLLSSLFGSHFQEENGEIYFVISVTGYNDVVTKKYPKGQPNIMILRSLESGGYKLSPKGKTELEIMKQNPLMRKSLNRSKKDAISKMQETISEEVKKL